MISENVVSLHSFCKYDAQKLHSIDSSETYALWKCLTALDEFLHLKNQNKLFFIQNNVRVDYLSLLNLFFCLTPPPYTQFRDPGVRPAPRGAFRLRGKEVVFFEAEWPGFEPLTLSI